MYTSIYIYTFIKRRTIYIYIYIHRNPVTDHMQWLLFHMVKPRDAMPCVAPRFKLTCSLLRNAELLLALYITHRLLPVVSSTLSNASFCSIAWQASVKYADGLRIAYLPLCASSNIFDRQLTTCFQTRVPNSSNNINVLTLARLSRRRPDMIIHNSLVSHSLRSKFTGRWPLPLQHGHMHSTSNLACSRLSRSRPTCGCAFGA